MILRYAGTDALIDSTLTILRNIFKIKSFLVTYCKFNGNLSLFPMRKRIDCCNISFHFTVNFLSFFQLENLFVDSTS